MFSAKELVFSATARCRCGSGLAYPRKSAGHARVRADGLLAQSAWICAAVLLGATDGGPGHDAYPFALYEIKSDEQPSAGGASTRGEGQGKVRIRGRAMCLTCGTVWNGAWVATSHRDPWNVGQCPTCSQISRDERGASLFGRVEVRCEAEVVDG